MCRDTAQRSCRSSTSLVFGDDDSRRVPRPPQTTQRQPEVPAVLVPAARRRFAAVYGEGRRSVQVSYDKINRTWQRFWFLLRVDVLMY